MSYVFSGSGSLNLVNLLGLSHIQELLACSITVRKRSPLADLVIEIGGEDSKIIIMNRHRNGVPEYSMNNSCAGGTGVFIDHMSALLGLTTQELDQKATQFQQIHKIAARCGVFAKTDVQSLLNQNVSKEDLSASILKAVVDQIITSLLSGYKMTPNQSVLLLGGPLTYLSMLRHFLNQTLNIQGRLPEQSLYYIAMGCAFHAHENRSTIRSLTINQLLEKLNNLNFGSLYDRHPPLFQTMSNYQQFVDGHVIDQMILKPFIQTSNIDGYLGIDCGSTTIKMVLIDEQRNLLYTDYHEHEGDVIQIFSTMLNKMSQIISNHVIIRRSCITGYGEELIKYGFHIDDSVVETVAHYIGAKCVCPDVSFILDIGGQDMKAIFVKNGVINHIMLNEACSAGCGSFLYNTMAGLNLNLNEFTQMCVKSQLPVKLGSKCTVFMNSCIKSAQRNHVNMEDICAGLCYSVIENALYKVIKLKNINDLGQNIVVQGGTFMNDCVLRAFELLTQKTALRPRIAKLMGAYGSALYAYQQHQKDPKLDTILELKPVKWSSRSLTCQGCPNHCTLTITDFSTQVQKYISGNRCDKMLGPINAKHSDLNLNMYQYQYNRIFNYYPSQIGWRRIMVGIPRVHVMYDLYPFWYTLLTCLGFGVQLSPESHQSLYDNGLLNHVIDTSCYSAKLVNGHIISLMENDQIQIIFYPTITCLKKEINKKYGYICQVCGSYPISIQNNLNPKRVPVINQTFNFELSKDSQINTMIDCFKKIGIKLMKKEVTEAFDQANLEQQKYYDDVFSQGCQIIEYLQRHKRYGIVLCGKPYHIDPLINHGIARLIESYHIPILTEISIIHVGHETSRFYEQDVNDWEHYMSRIYRATQKIVESPYLHMVHLVSFGCYIDGFGSEIIEKLLTDNKKIYTMIKLDETNQISMMKIRLRSLLHTLNESPVFIGNNEIRHTFLNKCHTLQDIDRSKTLVCLNYSRIVSYYPYKLRRLGYNVIICDDRPEYDVEITKYGGQMCPIILFQAKVIIHAIQRYNLDLDNVYFVIQILDGPCNCCEQISAILKMVYNYSGHYINYIKMEENLEMGMYIMCHEFLMNTYLTHQLCADQEKTELLYTKWTNIINQTTILSINSPWSLLRVMGQIVNDFEQLEKSDPSKYSKIGLVGASRYLDTLSQHFVIDYLKKDHLIYFNSITLTLYHYYKDNKMENLFEKYLGWFGRTVHTYMWWIEGGLISSFFNLLLKYLPIPDNNLFYYKIKSLNIETIIQQIIDRESSTPQIRSYVAEIVYLLENNVTNIILVDALNCASTIVSFKSLIGNIKKLYPNAHFMTIGYDPSQSLTNLQNRLKLFSESAKQKMTACHDDVEQSNQCDQCDQCEQCGQIKKN